MSMTKASLKARIISELTAVMTSEDSNAKITAFAEAMANAIVEEIQTNAVATITGVQSGPDTKQGTVT